MKVVGTGFGAMWLTTAPAGSHTFGSRLAAIVFPTRAKAQAAADQASESFGMLDMTFTVEAAE